MDCTQQLAMWLVSWKRALSRKIQCAMTPTKAFEKLEIQQLCPAYFFDILVQNWTLYSPLKKKNRYDVYFTCTSQEVFYQNFRGLWLFKKIVGDQFLQICVSEETPAFRLYSTRLQAIVLSFHYEMRGKGGRNPTPRYRFGRRNALKSFHKRQLYFKQK